MIFALMCMEVNLPIGDEPHYFRIHGHVYHLFSQLYPNEANKLGYGQLYIFDSGEEK
jgi:hypothetical protein